MESRKALSFLLALGVVLAFSGLLLSAERYIRLQHVAGVLPSLIPVNEAALQKALKAAELSPDHPP